LGKCSHKKLRVPLYVTCGFSIKPTLHTKKPFKILNASQDQIYFQRTFGVDQTALLAFIER